MCNFQTEMADKVTEAINMKPTSGTAPGTQLSGEVSYFFGILSVGPPTLTNWKPATEI